MHTSTSSSTVSRRFFVGCSSASILPIIALGKTEQEGFVALNELERRLSSWVKGFTHSIQITGSQQGIPEYRIELKRDQWSGFYQSLAENFELPRIEKNNRIELCSGAHSVRLCVA